MPTHYANSSSDFSDAADDESVSEPRLATDIVDELVSELQDIRSGVTTWGQWRFNPTHDQLVLLREGDDDCVLYDVPLEKCRTAAGRLEWIAQISEKSWAVSVVGDFVRALNALIGLREQDARARPVRNGPVGP